MADIDDYLLRFGSTAFLLNVFVDVLFPSSVLASASNSKTRFVCRVGFDRTADRVGVAGAECVTSKDFSFRAISMLYLDYLNLAPRNIMSKNQLRDDTIFAKSSRAGQSNRTSETMRLDYQSNEHVHSVDFF